MRKLTKIMLIVAASLVLCGVTLFGGVMMAVNWDFTKLSVSDLENNDYLIDEEYHHISIIADTANIVFLPSEDKATRVVCSEYVNANHKVVVVEDTLKILLQDHRKWYEHVGISFAQPKITVFLPVEAYSSLVVSSCTGHIKISDGFSFENMELSLRTGDIMLENMTADQMKLTLTTGDISLSNVQCGTLTSGGSTGRVYMKNVIASGKVTLKRTTGHICFEGCDAAAFSVRTSTGNVTGTLLTEKVISAHATTGRVHVPKSAGIGGLCEIATTTGDISIQIG